MPHPSTAINMWPVSPHRTVLIEHMFTGALAQASSFPFQNKETSNFVVIASCLPVKDQVFMQDKSIASDTCFGGHMDANC